MQPWLGNIYCSHGWRGVPQHTCAFLGWPHKRAGIDKQWQHRFDACRVDYGRRDKIMPNHTFTHVLNYALRKVCGGRWLRAVELAVKG